MKNENEKIQLKTSYIDNRPIGYCSETIFLVQIGKGRNKYRTKWEIKGNFGQAFLLYQGLNVHSGYKKRLLMPSSKSPTLARQLTS